jgi:hypothetical protein
MSPRPWLLLAAALAALPLAQAAAQDASTFPAGVQAVSNTPVRAGQDFTVTVAADAGPVAVTVCHFASADADGPDVCYMNLAAKPGPDGYAAATSAVKHPAWRDGDILGYKVTVGSGDSARHAPDRQAASGDPDYYRVTVGQDEGPAPQGSAVVEDAPTTAPAQPAADGVHASSATAAALLAVGLAALAAARRR